MNLLLIALAGAAAQLVDGSLGMGYGVTSASLLLFTGLAPALVSTSVNLAQLGTTLSSGVSHWRRGNVDRRALVRLAVPGGVAALIGGTLLSSLDMAIARPVMAVLLLLLGLSIVVRFVRARTRTGAGRDLPGRWSLLAPVAAVGGFTDAVGGGGWGPVVTSTLLATGRAEPRRVIGTVSAAEFIVTVCACAGLLTGIGLHGIPLLTVLALMAGGLVTAPIAARLAGVLPTRVLGVAVGALITHLNLSPALEAVGIEGGASALIRAVVMGVCLLALAAAILGAVREHRRDRGARERADVGPKVLNGVAETS